MTLKEQLSDDMKTALRAGDKQRLSVVRMALAAVKQREIDERAALDDTQVLATIEKMIKQRRESAVQYEAGNRNDLAARELAEIDILAAYLPEPLTDAALDALVDEALRSTAAVSMQDMGRVMALLRQQAAGRADMADISARVKRRLSAASRS